MNIGELVVQSRIRMHWYSGMNWYRHTTLNQYRGIVPLTQPYHYTTHAMNSNSILNVEVSCYRNYRSPENPRQVNLLNWLRSDKYADQVKLIRQTDDKADRDRLKAKLPAITSGGTFTYRETTGLTKFSGFMQVDIDLKENEQIGNFNQLKVFISLLPYVAYCGLSVSAKGFWLLIPVKDELAYKDHFRALRKDWKDIAGITVDSSRSDIAGLRGYSYDPEAYFNHGAIHYTKKLKEKVSKPVFKSFAGGSKDLYQRAMQHTQEKGISFVEGAKHDFIFHLCCSLNTYGVSQTDAENWIHQNLIPLNEIHSNCITDPYKRYASDFGKVNFIKDSGFKPANPPQNYKSIIPPNVEATKCSTLPHEAIPKDRGKAGATEINQYPELSELETFFAGITLPTTPVKLNNYSEIKDVPGFIRSHLATLRNNFGKHTYSPFLNRLIELKQHLTTK